MSKIKPDHNLVIKNKGNKNMKNLKNSNLKEVKPETTNDQEVDVSNSVSKSSEKCSLAMLDNMLKLGHITKEAYKNAKEDKNATKQPKSNHTKEMKKVQEAILTLIDQIVESKDNSMIDLADIKRLPSVVWKQAK